jgi:hypothetical protein
MIVGQVLYGIFFWLCLPLNLARYVETLATLSICELRMVRMV